MYCKVSEGRLAAPAVVSFAAGARKATTGELAPVVEVWRPGLTWRTWRAAAVVSASKGLFAVRVLVQKFAVRCDPRWRFHAATKSRVRRARSSQRRLKLPTLPLR
jgi:hypothetical protein